MRWAVLGCALFWAAVGYGIASAQQSHPHTWIKQFDQPGSTVDCCGGGDCVPLPDEVAMSLRVGQTVTLPAVGTWPERDVRVAVIYPAPPPTAEFDFALGWGCHTRCFFQHSGS